MKKTLTLLLCSGFAIYGTAQNYGSGTGTGTADPYAYNNTGTTVLAVPSDDVLSTAQTIPFAWNFFGVAVTSYKASDNGYITFDGAASVSDPVNTSIPSAGGPNNAIYAFWDAIDIAAGSGSVDEVRSFNYGTSPNQTHVIQWYSVTPASGTGFMYAAIRLHECGDFDIVLNYGNATGMSGTIGCEDATGANGLMVQGPSYGYPSVTAAGTDDIVYSFYSDGISYDAAITSSDFGNFVNVGANTVSGSFANYGSQTITSYDLNYSVDAGPAVTESITGASIASFGGTGTYTHGTPLTIAAGGEQHDVCVWIDNINGSADERTCNDQLCVDIFSNNGTSASTIKVVLEEFTGAWCGWCPDGAVIMEDLIAANPTNVIGISVHDGDAMEYSEGIRSEFGVSAYPNGMVDRKVFPGEADEPHSRGSWTANVNSQLTRYTPVEVSIDHSYDATTRTITATVTADFVDFAAGDMRFVMAVTEDNVTGTGSGYDQVNYLNTTAGHLYEGAGDPMIGFSHGHVLRANEPGVFGNAGIIPSPAAPGSSYSETFTYVIPTSYDETEISIVGFVSYSNPVVGEREILNADQQHLNVLALDEVSLLGSFTLSPNPVEDQFTIELDLRQEVSADIVIYNTSGQEVTKIASGNYAAGSQTIQASVGDLPAGLYYVTIHTENHSLTQKLVVK
ncbi:MAG: hypothetical protein COA38_14990 [Fluviicola sp.]|nr:MAG: hypothetical protein COA38_14990 [Fluviicola sp.]